MPFGSLFNIGHPAFRAVFGGRDEGPNYGTSRNPDPFLRGIDPRTAYETRKKAKRIYAPAMAALVAQGALLQPTLDLTRRAEMGAADILGDLGLRYAGLYGQAAPRYLEAYRGADPETSQLISLLTEDARSLVGRSTDPYEDRELTESLRTAQAGRGLGYSPSDAIREVLALDRARDERRIQRGQYAAGITEAGRAYYQPALLGLLGSYRPPTGQGHGTSTEDLLSLSINDTLARRNEHAARVAGNRALIGNIISSVLGVGGAAAGLCWVAEELYGVNDPRTHLARAWVRAHPANAFVQLYQRHGKQWAAWLKAHPWAKPLVQPIWDVMWRAEVESRNELRVELSGSSQLSTPSSLN